MDQYPFSFFSIAHFPAKAGTFSLTSKCKLCKLTLKEEELCFSTMFVLCYETLVFALVTFPLFSNALFIYNTPATNCPLNEALIHGIVAATSNVSPSGCRVQLS